jgi:hypothetical protein
MKKRSRQTCFFIILLTDTEIQKVRALRSVLFRQWSSIAPGQKLELKFDPEF